MTKDQSGFQIGCLDDISDDLYREDEAADIDERYKKGDPIGDEIYNGSLPDSFVLLSNELNDERCHIRTPAQQADWVRKKSNNQKSLGKILLHFNSVIDNLIKECQGNQKMLLGRLESDKKKGEDVVNIVYSLSLKEIVAGLLTDYKNGVSPYSIHELSELIVDDYNLSFQHFIKPEAARLLDELTSLKSCVTPNDSLDLFSTPKKPLKILEFEEREGVDFDYASTSLKRQIRVLSASIQGYKERLVTTNIRSCLAVSMQFFHAYRGGRNASFGVLDLVSEASEGLLHAADMFVYGVSVRFTTYAEHWIRLKVSRYIKNNNPVRVPIHVTEVVGQILRAFRERNQELIQQGAVGEISTIPMSKKEAEDVIGKSISDAIWEVACNRQKGVSPYVRCNVNPNHEEDELSFDYVIMESTQIEHEDFEECIDEANNILALAKKLTEKKWQEEYGVKIEKEQYDYLVCRFKSDMNFRDIALMYNIEVREVRRLIHLAIETLQSILVK